MRQALTFSAAAIAATLGIGHVAALEPVSDQLVVLTLDDPKASHYTHVDNLKRAVSQAVTGKIAMRDLARYVDWKQKPADPWRVIEERKSAVTQGRGAK